MGVWSSSTTECCCSPTRRTRPSTSASTSSRCSSAARGEGRFMYEKDGEKYYVFDSHLHFWDASPENWRPGAEEYAKGSIEDFEKDVFQDGGVDKAVLQSTYLKEWYTNGFNDIDQNAALLDRFGDKLILNGRFDPREGRAGLEQLEKDHARYGLKGVKLYTAEWYQGSRGWKLTDPEAVPFLDKCAELGIKNIHVHKGPTIWPLDKDAFDVSDIDHVAKVMGELLFWVGEDKMTFGSDYAIWEPKWQIEGFLNWEMPDESQYADYPRLDTNGKRKILGLNAAKLYDVEVPEELRVPEPVADPAAAVGVEG